MKTSGDTLMDQGEDGGKYMRTWVIAALLAVCAVCGEKAMAEDSPELVAVKQAQALAEAGKAAAEAKLAQAKAERAIASVDAMSKAELEKAVAEAEAAVYAKQQAAATTQAAIIAAEQANEKAKFGSVTANTVTPGAVTIQPGAGTLEANLLSARAVDAIGSLVGNEIKAASTVGAQGYVIFTGNQKPNFSDLRVFELKRSIVEQMFEIAQGNSEQADIAFSKLQKGASPVKLAGSVESLGLAITGIGALLDSAAKIGSFFQTSYDAAKLDVMGSDDDLLAVSVAKNLTDKDVFIPGRWSPPAEDDQINKTLSATIKARSRSAGTLSNNQAQIQVLEAMQASVKTDDAKQQTQNVAAAYERAIAAHQLAQKAFDDFLVALAAADTAGVPLTAKIADQKVASQKLANGAASILLHMHVASGGSYTKKNLWTFFGTMPFYAAGGAVASYLLIDKDGKIVKAGQFQKHGGYWKVSEVPSILSMR